MGAVPLTVHKGAQGWLWRAGNLLAPWAAATATGVLRSAYSRVQLPRLRKRRMELLGKLKVRGHVHSLGLTSLPALVIRCTARHARLCPTCDLLVLHGLQRGS